MKTFPNSPASRLSWLLGAGLLLSATAAQAQNVWVGGISTEYAVPGNWSLGRVPNSGDNVVINPGGNQPVINQFGAANTLRINQGAMLTIGALGNLDLYGNLEDNGTLVGNGSITTRGTGTAPQTLDGTAAGTSGIITLNDLIVATMPGAVLTTPLRLNRLLSLTGNLITTNLGPLTLLSTPNTGTNPNVTAFVVNNGGTVNSGTGVTLPTGATGTGIVTMQRAIDNSINAGLGYRHYSSPVSNTTVADLTTSGFTPEVSQADVYNNSATPPTTRPYPTVYLYDQTRVVLQNSTTPVFDKGFFVPGSVAASTPLLVGRGYAVNLNGSQLVDFVGMLNQNDTYSVSISRNAQGTANFSSSGYNFLGNPYPSPIDFSRITDAERARMQIYNSLYVYQSTGQYVGMYRTYVNGVGNPIIPSSQGFFVRMNAANAAGGATLTNTFTFRSSYRLTSSDNTAFNRPVADTRPQVELTLGNSAMATLDLFNLYFQAGSTAGTDDGFDATKMPNDNGMSVNSTSTTGEALAIDGRPMPTGELTIPLHVGVAADGTYSLQASKLANLGGLYVYLRDIQKSTLTDLSQQASYTFSTSAANTTARFELVVSPQPLANAPAALARQVALYPNPAKNSASLELPASIGKDAVSVSLIDVMGRTVRTIELPAQGSTAHQLDLHGMAAGVYVVRLRTNAGTVVNRLNVE